jgi:methionine--tRNA ligase beta chain
MISYEDFKKIELRVAEILSAERVEGSDKLLKLEVSLGNNETRQIIAGISKQYSPEDLVPPAFAEASAGRRKIIIVANLEPRKLMGLESQGMLLAASIGATGPVLLIPDQSIDAGAEVR